MNWSQFEHIIRAASQITGLNEFVVIGSQAILAIHDDAPRSLRTSAELDLYPKANPERSIEIDGAIGELSLFHETHGIYAHGVAPDTAHLPSDWEKRCIVRTIIHEQNKIFVHAPELHDLAFSKILAGRPKDIEYVRELLRCELIGFGRLHDLVISHSTPQNLPLLENILTNLRKN